MEGPTPIGKGEQMKLKKELKTLRQTEAELENVLKNLIKIRDRIIEERKVEMTKPEWARKAGILEGLEAELRNNDTQLDSFMRKTANVGFVTDYINKRHEELEKRKNEKGY